MDTIRVRKGDTAPLAYVIQDFNSDTGVTARDLTNCTVKFYMYCDERVENHEGRVQSATESTVTLGASASSYDNAYVDEFITITGGTGSGQSIKITAYDGATKVATLETNWTTIPDASSRYKLVIRQSGYITDGLACTILDADVGSIQYEFPTNNCQETATNGMYKIKFMVTDEDGATKKYPYETQWLHVYDDAGN